MNSIVLPIGGSSINGQGEPDLGFLHAISEMIIKKNKNSGSGRFGFVAGGGKIARVYANAARALGASEFNADEIAIMSTKQNARLLLEALRSAGCDVHGQVLETFGQAVTCHEQCVVMGGTIPGISTDADSVLLAEAMGARRVINISNVDAIYDSDPKKNPSAKKFTRMAYDELIQLATRSDKRMAGTNFVFDLLACKLIARSGIEAHFVSNQKLDDIWQAISGGRHGGTVVGNFSGIGGK